MAKFTDRKINKNGAQQNLYAMPFGTLRIAKPLAVIKEIKKHKQYEERTINDYTFNICGM